MAVAAASLPGCWLFEIDRDDVGAPCAHTLVGVIGKGRREARLKLVEAFERSNQGV